MVGQLGGLLGQAQNLIQVQIPYRHVLNPGKGFVNLVRLLRGYETQVPLWEQILRQAGDSPQHRDSANPLYGLPEDGFMP
jgi:hypothetical protein